MKKDENVSSSDLAYAREITHRLRGGASAEGTKSLESACLNYIKFSATPFFQKVPTPHQEEPTSSINIDFGETNSFGPDTWEKLLDWCLKMVHAETAFLMDDVGLTIASRGKMSVNEAEVSGNRLMIAFEQGIQMGLEGSAPRSLSFEFDTLWVTGIPVQPTADTDLMVGIISAAPIPDATRRTIERVITEKVTTQQSG